MRKRWIVGLALTLGIACYSPTAPSQLLLGDWVGIVSGSHIDYVEIRIAEESGKTTGMACYWIGDPIRLRWSDAPVVISGRQISVTFASPGLWAGHTFTGTISRHNDELITLEMDGPASPGSPVVPKVYLRHGGDYCAIAR